MDHGPWMERRGRATLKRLRRYVCLPVVGVFCLHVRVCKVQIKSECNVGWVLGCDLGGVVHFRYCLSGLAAQESI